MVYIIKSHKYPSGAGEYSHFFIYTKNKNQELGTCSLFGSKSLLSSFEKFSCNQLLIVSVISKHSDMQILLRYAFISATVSDMQDI